jgi:hypothetical protein
MPHRLHRPAQTLLLALALLPWALPSRAASYVPMTDEALVDTAPLIAVVEVVGREDAGSRPVTGYTLRVLNALKGRLPLRDVVVQVPGGATADGLFLRIAGMPSFPAGERALLFLSPRPDGTFNIFQLFLGAFHEVPAGDRRLALRQLAGARAVRLPGRISPPEPVRDFDRFVAWIEARVRGIRSPRTYEITAGGSGVEQAIEAFQLFQDSDDGLALRWFAFDEGTSVEWQAHENGQQGLTGGGFSEFQTALTAWADDPGSNILHNYTGTTTSIAGLETFDGLNTIVFDDPTHIMPSFNCASGGILALGGPWYSSSLRMFSGLSYHEILSADIVTNSGIGCFIEDLTPPSETAQELFAHELGHTLGLAHSSDATVLMYPFIHADGRGARLEDDERDAVAILYRKEQDFYTLTPCRLFDSRSGAPLSAGSTRIVPTQGLCGIPASARVLAVNVTAVGASASGHLTLFAQYETPPSTSAINFSAGVVRANNALANLAATSHAFEIHPGLPPGGSVHVLVDVFGYFE